MSPNRPAAVSRAIGIAAHRSADPAGPKGAQTASVARVHRVPAITVIVAKPKELLIVGVTRDGKPFRPSDWSERLAGVMSAFRPTGAHSGIAAFIGYSPYCVPRTVDGVKCVLVNEALRDIEVMAWDFVMNFARDNELEVRDTMHEAGFSQRQ